jgi:hypothetical protein
MFWVQLLVAIVLAVVSYLIMPKPKQPQPPGTRDLESPTADAGRPLPVVFGTLTVKGLNVVWYGELQVKTEKVKM